MICLTYGELGWLAAALVIGYIVGRLVRRLMQ